MAEVSSDTPHLQSAFAQLERALIDDYLRVHGHDPATLRERGDHEARTLLSEASTYAAMKLTEVESRAHYVHDIHSARES